MKPFREIDASRLGATDVAEEMRRHGYLLVRGLLPSAHLDPLLWQITDILADAEWLLPGSAPIARIANPQAACANDDRAYKAVYERIFGLQSFHRLPHHALLQETMKLLVGPELLIHPKSVGRFVFPNFERGTIHAHQDHTAVGGDEESFTAWIPLHDCPAEEGSLRIKSGSHRFGLQPTAGQTGYIPTGAERGESWVGGDVNAGDVLLFHSLTVHEALPNRSKRLRISFDCRFQSYRRAVNPGTLVFTGSSGRSWKSIYEKWESDDLKYYWAQLPLELKPSKLELEQLAAISDSMDMRDRYARILERIGELWS